MAWELTPGRSEINVMGAVSDSPGSRPDTLTNASLTRLALR